MAEVLVTGKKISDMDLVSDIVGTEKIPTGVVGDKAVTTGQLLTYLDNNGMSAWGRISGDISTQTDLINKFNQQDLELANHAGNTQNPHNVTKTQVGLGNVDDTADLDKPVSTSTQAAIDVVVESLSNHTENHLNPHNVTKTQVGLGNVDDTSDVNKPISFATQNALNLKVDEVEFDEYKDFLERGNRYKYNASLSPYSKGQIIQSDNELVEYLSLVDNNTVNPNTTPLTGSWKVYTGDGSVPVATDTVSGTTKLVNNLTSVDTTSALTASQGKLLNDQAFGVNQTYIDVTSSRSLGIPYTNNTTRPIKVIIVNTYATVGDPLNVYINGLLIMSVDKGADGEAADTQIDVLPNATYMFTKPVNPNIVSWVELR